MGSSAFRRTEILGLSPIFQIPMPHSPPPHCRVAVWHRRESTIAMISVCEDMCKSRPLYAAGGNVAVYSCGGELSGASSEGYT